MAALRGPVADVHAVASRTQDMPGHHPAADQHPDRDRRRRFDVLSYRLLVVRARRSLPSQVGRAVDGTAAVHVPGPVLAHCGSPTAVPATRPPLTDPPRFRRQATGTAARGPGPPLSSAPPLAAQGPGAAVAVCPLGFGLTDRADIATTRPAALRPVDPGASPRTSTSMRGTSRTRESSCDLRRILQHGRCSGAHPALPSLARPARG